MISKRQSFKIIFPKISLQWKLNFFEQLSLLLSSGLPMERSLALLRSNEPPKSSGFMILEKLWMDVQAGFLLSEAMKKQNGFSELEIKLVSAAEYTGNPEKALQKLHHILSERKQFVSKFKLAMIYPTMVLLVAILAVILLSTLVVPRFEDMLTSHQVSLPWITRWTVACSHFLMDHGISVLMVLGMIVFLGAYGNTFSFFRKWKEKMIMHIPVIRSIMLTNDKALFFATAEMLLNADLPLLDAIAYAVPICRLPSLKIFLTHMVERMKLGENMSEVMRRSPWFSQTDIGLLFAGEKSGNLKNILSTLANDYRIKTEHQLTRISAYVEPVIILFLAVVVGIVALSLFLPLSQLFKALNM